MTGFIGGFVEGFVEVLVFGLQDGAIIAFVGLGIALVFKATRIINFGQGELGTVPAFAALLMMSSFDLDRTVSDSTFVLIVATLLAVALGAGLGVLMNVIVVRRLASASPVTSLVATAGVMLLLVAIQVIAFEPRGRSFPRFIDGKFGIPGFDVEMAWHTVVIIAVLAASAAALALFFRTPPGVALLATAQDPFAAELQGVPVARMRTLAWGAAGALGALGGVLGAGVFENLSPGLMTSTFLIPAFTGVVLGGITSMVGAVVGGLAIGFITNGANKLVAVFELDVPGPPFAATFVVLLLVLLFRPRGLFGQEA
ncbi:MAG TPA: branched-chain amino acid ABC transporter permease [Acidimicrobiales bacterium]